MMSSVLSCTRSSRRRTTGLNILALVTAVGLLVAAPAAHAAGDSWSPAGTMATPQNGATATLLANGKVLVVGGTSSGAAELYDPGTNSWMPAGTLATPRRGHTATLLGNGKVLVAGGASTSGSNSGSSLATAELYDPGTNAWSAAASMSAAREGATATLLGTGKLLVAGGYDIDLWDNVVGAELYNATTNTWSSAGTMASGRMGHTATKLGSGKTLVAGGWALTSDGVFVLVPGTEVYDPATNVWSAAGTLATPRSAHTATILPTGRVLVAGGGAGGTPLATAELYDPGTNSWSAAASMGTPRHLPTATLLPSGKVLLAGGYIGGSTGSDITASAELYDAATNPWSAAASMGTPRYSHAAARLDSGKVLVAGGYTPCTNPDPMTCANLAVLTATAETYEPPAATGTTQNVSVTDSGYSPVALPLKGQGYIAQWNFASTNTRSHTATDSSGMNLFDSGPKAPGTSYSFTFTAAGTYKYKSTAA